MGTHPLKLQAEDRNHVARRSGTEGGPSTVQLSQVDVRQGNAKETQRGQGQETSRQLEALAHPVTPAPGRLRQDDLRLKSILSS